MFHSRMADLMKHQMEATKMTVDAANQLTKLKDQTAATPRPTPKSKSRKSNSKVSSSIPTEDIKSIISKTESSIPEILNVVEATDRSAKDIQRSIKTALEELSIADNDETSRTSNITEEIMAELTDENDFSKKSRDTTDDDDNDSSSSTWITGNLFLQHLEDQRIRDRQQYGMIKKREKVLTLKTKDILKDISAQKMAFAQDESKLVQLAQKEKKVRKKYRKQKSDLSNLLYTLQVAEKERNLLFRQHKKLSKGKESLNKASTVSSITPEISSEEELSSMAVEKPKAAKIALKTPLSPKRTMPMHRTRKRSRHSSADSEDSMMSNNEILSTSQVETVSSAVSDQSDLEIRVHTLKDELRERMRTAAKLKKEQKLARQERLKAQEDALKKQIEVYDHLIQQTKADIEVNSNSSPTRLQQQNVTQPQIKIPKQHSRSPDSQVSTGSEAQASLEESSSTDTIIASPQKPATPNEIVEPQPNNNYSDDFTSSLSSNPPSLESSKVFPMPEKSVDAICGHLLEVMIEDTVGRIKAKNDNNEAQSFAETPKSTSPTTAAITTKSKSPVSASPSHMQTAFDVSSESSDDDDDQGELSNFKACSPFERSLVGAISRIHCNSILDIPIFDFFSIFPFFIRERYTKCKHLS